VLLSVVLSRTVLLLYLYLSPESFRRKALFTRAAPNISTKALLPSCFRCSYVLSQSLSFSLGRGDDVRGLFCTATSYEKYGGELTVYREGWAEGAQAKGRIVKGLSRPKEGRDAR
jgi:hypothetical protein